MQPIDSFDIVIDLADTAFTFDEFQAYLDQLDNEAGLRLP